MMDNDTKFTLTVKQLRKLVNETQKLDEGIFDWFKKKPAQGGATPAAPASPAGAAQGAEPDATPQQQSVFQKMLNNFLSWIVNIGKVDENKLMASLPDDVKSDPVKLEQAKKDAQRFALGKLVTALSAIVGSPDTQSAIATVKQEQQVANQDSAAAKKELQQIQQDQPQSGDQAQPTNEDEENPWGSWEPGTDEVAQYIFDHYKELTGVPKTVVYEVFLGKRDLQDLAPACMALQDWLEGQGLDAAQITEVFSAVDCFFANNKPEEIDEGLWDRFKAKTAGWAGMAKGVGHNIQSWASGDADGKNRTVAKQSVWGRAQSDKFASLINSYITKVSNLRADLTRHMRLWQDKPEEKVQAAEMIASMNEFVKQAQAALKQAQDDLKKANYDRKKQDQQQGDQKKGEQTSNDKAADKSTEQKSKDADNKAAGDANKKSDDKKAQDKDDKKTDDSQEAKESLLFEGLGPGDGPDDGKPHDYTVYFTDDAMDAHKPEMTLKQVTRKEAFEQIGEVHGNLGEDPVGILEDDEVVLARYFHWCETGMTGLPGEKRKHKYRAQFKSSIDLDDEDAVLGGEDDIWVYETDSRDSAYAKLAEKISQTGEFPVKLTEDGVDILNDFTAWCETDLQTINEGVWNFLKGVGNAVGTAAKQGVKNAIGTAIGAGQEIGAAWKNRNKPPEPADWANKLARTIGELEMDLKDMGWSAKQNPGLGKVIQDLEKSANKIHGKGEKGVVTNLDKIRHGVGKLTGAMVMGAVTGVALGAVTKPLRAFMSPRAHAALVAATTVLLRAVLRNIQNMDIKLDAAEEKKAQEALQKAPSEPAVQGGAQPPPLPTEQPAVQAVAEPGTQATTPASATSTQSGAPAAARAPVEQPQVAPAAPAPAPTAAAVPTAAPSPAAAASTEPVTPATPPPQPTAAVSAASPTAQPGAVPAAPTASPADAALHAKRSAAAKKGAETKRRNAAAAAALHQKRSAAAKKGAQTRANKLAELKARRSAAAKRAAQTRAANKVAGAKKQPVNKKTRRVQNVQENSKFCLTIGQLRKLIWEATNG